MLKRLLLLAATAVAAAGGWAAWTLWPRVEEIPETLETIDADVDPLAVTLPAQGPLPALALRDLAGKTAFMVIQGKESMSSREGRDLTRALDRWTYPPDVVGYSIGDAEGLGLLADKIEQEFVGPMRAESRWPLYVDFDGALLRTFKLPKGHIALLVLGPTGAVLLRHSGPADAARVEEIRAVLRASDPPAGPAAPEFSIGELNRERCRDPGCLLVFLGGPVSRADVPGIEGGFSGSMSEEFEQAKKPDVRSMSLLANGWDLAAAKVPFAVVGAVSGLELPGGAVIESAPEARRAFSLEDGQPAMVVVQRDAVPFREVGTIPFWKFGIVGHLLGIEARDRHEEDE